MGLITGPETLNVTTKEGAVEIDLVTHEAKKFFKLLLTRNGYVLEQLYSPIVLIESPHLEELRDIAKGCLTRHHAHHYLGFSATQWALFVKESPPRLKPLLYVYRILLTGIHLMRTGTIEADLSRLCGEYGLTHVPELVAAKRNGSEKEKFPEADTRFHEAEYLRLRRQLEEASTTSFLPDNPSAQARLHDLLVRLRLEWA